MPSLRDTLRRRLLPRLVVSLSRARARGGVLTRLRRGLGLRPRLELYFAFDDPYAAVGLPGVVALARHYAVELRLYPLLARGIDGDPAAEARRRHAVIDTARLLERDGRDLRRRAPLDAEQASFLALWTQQASAHPAVGEFAAAAIEQLWLGSEGAVRREDYVELHRRILGAAPASEIGAPLWPINANRRRLLARGHWESPAARLEGEWFFAHERLPRMAARLEALQP